MKSRQTLEAWTRLKTKLGKLSHLSKHKELIKEAIEFHLYQTSNFSAGLRGEILPNNYQITPLTEPTTPLYEMGKLSPV
jgi:hypothetical protein